MPCLLINLTAVALHSPPSECVYSSSTLPNLSKTHSNACLQSSAVLPLMGYPTTKREKYINSYEHMLKLYIIRALPNTRHIGVYLLLLVVCNIVVVTRRKFQLLCIMCPNHVSTFCFVILGTIALAFFPGCCLAVGAILTILCLLQ